MGECLRSGWLIDNHLAFHLYLSHPFHCQSVKFRKNESKKSTAEEKWPQITARHNRRSKPDSGVGVRGLFTSIKLSKWKSILCVPAFYNGEVPRVHAEGWGGKGESASRKRGRKLLGTVGFGLESRPNWPPDHITHKYLFWLCFCGINLNECLYHCSCTLLKYYCTWKLKFAENLVNLRPSKM